MQEKTGRRVAVVTDSTADIPRSFVEEYGIHVVPQILIMGDQSWRDGVDIDSPAFYELLRSSPLFPASSQPSVTSFQEVFAQLSQEAEGIVAVLISNELSGTLNSALMAASSMPEGSPPIEIVDARAVSMQLGFIVLAAARAAAAGSDLHTVANVTRDLVGRVHVYFVVDTLEYLHRGGRIGAAAKLVLTALNVKPVLAIRDGIVTPVAKVRTRRKALETMFDLVAEQVTQDSRVHMSVLHVAAPEEAAQLTEQLEARFRPVEMIRTECGPVIGTHAGPGTVGVAFYVE